MSSELAIAVRNVSKLYRMYETPADRLKQMLWRGRRNFGDEFWALRDISFEVARGETVGIVGRNGSGKSTLLQIICGTVTPTSGHIERNGRISALLELGSGFNPEFTGRENVFLNGSILGFSRSEMESRFDEIAGFADIGDFIDSPVKHYSSGMFARLAFAVAVHVNPEVLIVDEILAVGDASFQRRCLNKFYEIRESGCAILFVSHDQYQVKSICNRALYLESGRQKLFTSASLVVDQYCSDTELSTDRISEGTKDSGKGVHAEGCQLTEHNQESLFRIFSVSLLNSDEEEIEKVKTGEKIYLEFQVEALVDQPPSTVSYVFNLYRHDDLYISGTTTLMDGYAAHESSRHAKIRIEFPKIPLLSGRFKWRVAVNDSKGFITYAEAKDVCPFQVNDNFEAVGLTVLEHFWLHKTDTTQIEIDDGKIES